MDECDGELRTERPGKRISLQKTVTFYLFIFYFIMKILTDLTLIGSAATKKSLVTIFVSTLGTNVNK